MEPRAQARDVLRLLGQEPVRDWNFRYVDDDGVTHIEGDRSRAHKTPALRTACGFTVTFGMMWDDDQTLVVTCVRCAGSR